MKTLKLTNKRNFQTIIGKDKITFLRNDLIEVLYSRTGTLLFKNDELLVVLSDLFDNEEIENQLEELLILSNNKEWIVDHNSKEYDFK